jgi:nicotinamidase-related amidase
MNSEKNSALLIMDIQLGIVDQIGENKKSFIKNIGSAIDAAHKSSIPVIFVVVGFRPGFPEVSDRNKLFNSIKGGNSQGFINPKPVIELMGDDILVMKRRVSAFSGSDLDTILRGKNINHLVLAGIATSGVVLSTVREAADKDYHITVIGDLCADSKKDVHDILLEKVFPWQAEVTTCEEWVEQLGA